MKKYKIGLFGKYINHISLIKNFNHILKDCKFYHLKEKESYKKILHQKIDIIISYGYGVIFKKDFFLKNPRCKIINMHIGYLPHGRGIYPNLISIIKGKKCGFSVHIIDNRKIDCGPLIYRKQVMFSKGETMKTLFENIKKNLDSYIESNLKKILFTKKTKKFQRKYKYFSRDEASKYFEKLPDGWDTTIKKIKKIKFE